jgi:hypothetical protein
VKLPALIGAAVAVWLTLPAAAGAQTLRGHLVDAESGAGMAASLVVLLDAARAQRATVLTDSLGRFVLRAPAEGTYTLRAERIGYQSTTSAPLRLGAGETLTYEMRISAQPILLAPIVAQAGRRRCARVADAGEGTLAVWEEARKALNAAVHTSAGGVRHHVTRYERDLDPSGRRVVRERRDSTALVTERPFVGAAVERLRSEGFVVRDGTGFVWYAPDAEILLSDAFLDGHCFRIVRAPRGEEGLVGLAFVPVGSSGAPDIQGTLWIEQRSAELRSLEFEYVRLGGLGLGADLRGIPLGGRVEFERLPSGAWIASQWSIRMPLVAESRVQIGANAGQSRWSVLGIREEGGQVDRVTDARGNPLRRSQAVLVRGMVYDSIGGRPLAGARVFLVGTPDTVVTDAAGAFSLTAVGGAEYAVGFSHRMIDTLGYTPPPIRVATGPEGAEGVRLSVPSLVAIRASSCTADARPPGTAPVVGTVINRASDTPLAGATVAFTWTAGGERRRLETTTDAAGRYVVCDLPVGLRIRAEAQFLEAVSGAVDFALDHPTPVTRDLALAWYQTATQVHGGPAIAASRQPVRLSGRISGADGQPVAGAVVRLAGTDLRRTTDGAGRFAFAAVAPGLYRLAVEHPAHQPLSREVAVGGGGVEIDLELSPAQ